MQDKRVRSTLNSQSETANQLTYIEINDPNPDPDRNPDKIMPTI